MGSVGNNTTVNTNKSPLELVRMNSRQFNNALIEAKKNKASVVEYTGIDGKVYKRWWNGATYVDRSTALYEGEMKGTYKAKFKLED